MSKFKDQIQKYLTFRIWHSFAPWNLVFDIGLWNNAHRFACPFGNARVQKGSGSDHPEGERIRG
jgi:hypothetical protein